MNQNNAFFRFYRELNDFLPEPKKNAIITYRFNGNPSVKDAIEAIGVPHVEVDIIMINGASVRFSHPLKNGDRVEVWPGFNDLSGSDVIHLLKKHRGEIRYILDVHLGRLSRLLRLIGFDTLYRNDYTDAEIIKIAREERRVILTRDIGILKVGEVKEGYWIRSQHPRKQLLEIVERFDLRTKMKPFHRCMICNGIILTVDKESIDRYLEPGTRKYYREFFRCSSCGNVYWKGSHYYRMKGIVEEIISGE